MRYFALAAVAAVTACGNVESVITDYGPVRPVVIQNADVDWKIYDKPEERRMMVAPTSASVWKAGAGEKWADSSRFMSAAQASLTPRGCTATSIKPLVKAQMEVAYTC